MAGAKQETPGIAERRTFGAQTGPEEFLHGQSVVKAGKKSKPRIFPQFSSFRWPAKKSRSRTKVNDSS
jgi:hypothetical protein